MLDLFCGRGGWTNAFLKRGWDCVGIDLFHQPEYRGEFIQDDIMNITPEFIREFDFACASSPCEEFSVHGMKHFHPNPKFPDMGLALFCWTRRQLDLSGISYVMENVKAAQGFVGNAVHRCGPFYLWGNAVPPLMIQGTFKKGMRFMPGNVYKGRGFDRLELQARRKVRTDYQRMKVEGAGGRRALLTAKTATIPPELANCVADYAERICQRSKDGGGMGPAQNDKAQDAL